MLSDNFWPLAFVPLFIAGWIAFSCLLAYMSGWRDLARAYRTNGPFSGTVLRPWAASMRWGVNYNGLLGIGADSLGVYLTISWIFRAGQPNLFIPFEEISVEKTGSSDALSRSQPLSALLRRIVGKWDRKGWFSYVKLTFEKCPNTYLLISTRVAKKLSEASGYQFQVAETG